MVPGVSCFVEKGTENASKEFILTTPSPIVLDTTELTFVLRGSNTSASINISPDFFFSYGELNLSSFSYTPRNL